MHRVWWTLAVWGCADLPDLSTGSDVDGDGWTNEEEIASQTPITNRYIHPYEHGDYLLGDAPFPVQDTGMFAVGDVVDNFTLTDSYGQAVDLYAFKGRWIFLTFAAMWESPMVDVIDDLPDTQAAHVDDLTVISVVVEDVMGDPPDDEDLDAWKEFFALDGIPVLSDPDKEIVHRFGPAGTYPVFVLIAPDMTLDSSPMPWELEDALP